MGRACILIWLAAVAMVACGAEPGQTRWHVTEPVQSERERVGSVEPETGASDIVHRHDPEDPTWATSAPSTEGWKWSQLIRFAIRTDTYTTDKVVYFRLPEGIVPNAKRRIFEFKGARRAMADEAPRHPVWRIGAGKDELRVRVSHDSVQVVRFPKAVEIEHPPDDNFGPKLLPRFPDEANTITEVNDPERSDIAYTLEVWEEGEWRTVTVVRRRQQPHSFPLWVHYRAAKEEAK